MPDLLDHHRRLPFVAGEAPWIEDDEPGLRRKPHAAIARADACRLHAAIGLAVAYAVALVERDRKQRTPVAAGKGIERAALDAEDAAVGRHPEPLLVVFQNLMDHIVVEAVGAADARDGPSLAVSATSQAIEAAILGADPDALLAIDVDRAHEIARQTVLDRDHADAPSVDERDAAAVGSDPGRAVIRGLDDADGAVRQPVGGREMAPRAVDGSAIESALGSNP